MVARLDDNRRVLMWRVDRLSLIAPRLGENEGETRRKFAQSSPIAWTIPQPDGPNHLGLRALIAGTCRNRVRRCVGVGVGGGGVMACASHLLRVDKQKVAGGVLLAAARNHLFVRKAVNTPSISLQLQ